MSNRFAVVTGGAGGLGGMIAEELARHGYVALIWDLPDVDVTKGASMFDATEQLPDRVDALVNCAGFNRLAPIETLEIAAFDQHMAVNARSHWLATRGMLPRLRGGVVCNVISNASHMPMRMSLAYNASKAAAAMITQQMARELGKPHDLTIFGVSPNRLKGTPMSVAVDKEVAALRGWSLEETRRQQLEALPTGEETDPAMVAEFIGFLLSKKERHKYLHGAILDYGI